MSNNRYLIAVVLVTIASVNAGQIFTEQQRPKLKFRPDPDWFANMQQPVEQSPSYFEQSDQPMPRPDRQFQDLYVEDFEPSIETEFSGGSKFPRHPSQESAIFQSLCPISHTHVYLENAEYEYRPSSYVELSCAHPYGQNAVLHQRNRVCGLHGFSCIQLKRTIFLTRRAFGSDCWEVETRNISSACECMWPKHAKGNWGNLSASLATLPWPSD